MPGVTGVSVVVPVSILILSPIAMESVSIFIPMPLLKELSFISTVMVVSLFRLKAMFCVVNGIIAPSLFIHRSDTGRFSE